MMWVAFGLLYSKMQQDKVDTAESLGNNLQGSLPAPTYLRFRQIASLLQSDTLMNKLDLKYFSELSMIRLGILSHQGMPDILLR